VVVVVVVGVVAVCGEVVGTGRVGTVAMAVQVGIGVGFG